MPSIIFCIVFGNKTCSTFKTLAASDSGVSSKAIDTVCCVKTAPSSYSSFTKWIVTPLSINFLGNYSVSSEIFNDFDLSSYIGLLRASVLASGIIFELPIIIYFLTRVGIVSPEFLKKNRKISLVVVLSLSAIITPPDVVSQIIVSIPILILYEVSIVIAKIVTRNQDKGLTNV